MTQEIKFGCALLPGGVARTCRGYLIQRHSMWAPYAPQPPTMAPIARPLGPPASAPIPMEVPTTETRKTFSPFDIPWCLCWVSRAYDLLRRVCRLCKAGERGSEEVGGVELELAACELDPVPCAGGSPLAKENSGTSRHNARIAITALFILQNPIGRNP